MTSHDSEAGLLAAIDDAEYDVSVYDRVFRTLAVVAATGCVATTFGIVLGVMVLGTNNGMGGYVAVIIVPGAMSGLGALGALWFWFFMQNTRAHDFRDPGLARPWTGGPKKRLRAARRDHEQWLMRSTR